MSFVTKKILKNGEGRWTWPVEVGIPLYSAFNPAELQKYHWSKDLSTVKVVDPVFGPALDILQLYGLPEAADFLAKTRQAKKPVQCTAILIKTDAPYPVSKQAKEDAAKMAAELAGLTGAGGVFFYHTKKDIADWQDNFIIEVSHDKGVEEAIKSISDTSGYFFVSPGLEKQTRLSTLVEQMSKDLLAGRSRVFRTIFFGLINPWEHRPVKPSELGAFLRDQKYRLDYSGESKTGSSIKQANASLKKVPAKHTAKAKKPVPKKAAVKKKSTSPTSRKIFNPGTGNKITGGVSKGKIFTGGKKHLDQINKISKSISHLANIEYNIKGGNDLSMALEKLDKILKSRERKPEPRYLQAYFKKKGSPKMITEHLLPQTTYNLNVWIGEKLAGAIQSTTEFETSVLFKDIKVKEAMIDLEVRCNTSKKIMTGRVRLPRDGDSAMAKFAISTGNKKGLFEAEIYAYHQSRLLQKSVLKIDIRKATDKPVLKEAVLKQEAVIRKQLEDIGNREPYAASIVFPKEKKNNVPLPGLTGNKPAGIPYNRAMQTLMDEIQDIIETVTTDETIRKPKFDSEENTTLIKKLAFRGAKLYSVYLKKIKQEGPIQIISNTGEYAPLEFAYSYDAPDLNAAVCPNAKAALEEGACKNCFSKKEDRHAHICPFGFWGLNRVIERHSYEKKEDENKSDYVVKTEPSDKRPPLQLFRKTLFAETDRMENGNKGIIKQVDEVIRKNCGETNKATTWKNWNKLAAGKQPESFILIVHNENDQVAGECLEIGDSDLLPVARFNAEYINAESKTRTPFVILIGCETTNVRSYAFDASNNLLSSGAAIVLSNFTKVRGSHAANIVMRLITLLKENTGATTLGSIVLKLRQQLVAEGVMASLSLLSHGDADWKIKT